MAFFLTLKQIYPTLIFELVRLFNYIKKNDVPKLMIILICFSRVHPSFDFVSGLTFLHILDFIFSSLYLLLFLMHIIYFFCFMYYISFNIRKTIYIMPKMLYIYSVTVLLLHFIIQYTLSENTSALIIFKIIYLFFLFNIAVNLRNIFTQQYINVQNSIFKKIRTHTGLVVIASTPNCFFARNRINLNYYMIGFNTNIKTWFILGVFVIMEQDGLYFNKTFINYNEIIMFNQTFDKKITHYTATELDTVIMYSI